MRSRRMASAGSKCVLALVVLVVGCSDRGTEPAGKGPGDGGTVSFAGDLQPIFDADCVGCHGADGNGDLDLRPGLAWENLVGAASSGYSQTRVVPGKPEESLLYLKLSGSAGVGARMPAGGALDSAEIESFRVWISDGALDN